MVPWGDELVRWRRTAGLSRAQLSRLAHVSTKNIYNLETRGQRPTVGTVKALTEALDRALRQTPDAWTDVERRRFLCGAEAVDGPRSVVSSVVGVDTSPASPLRSDPTGPAPMPATTGELPVAPPRVMAPGPDPDADPPRDRRRRGHRWGIAAVTAAVLGATAVVITASSWSADDTTGAAVPSDLVPSPPAFTTDLGPPRWWVANDLTATRHSGTSVALGRAGDIPVVGDHDGQPGDEMGVFRPSDGNVYWAGTVVESEHVDAAQPGDWPLVGNWDGMGGDDVGVYRPAQSVVLIGSDPANGMTVQLTGADVVPLAGDWNGDGRDDVGSFHLTTLTFDRHLLGGAVLPPVPFGEPGDIPLVGDWDGDRVDEFAVYRPTTRSFRFADASGTEIGQVVFGSDAVKIPVVGDWDGDGRDSHGVIQR